MTGAALVIAALDTRRVDDDCIDAGASEKPGDFGLGRLYRAANVRKLARPQDPFPAQSFRIGTRNNTKGRFYLFAAPAANDCYLAQSARSCARQPGGDPIPQKARARIERLLDQLDLVLKLIDQVELARDAVLKKDAPADEAERMIRSLTDLRSIGPDVATLLVREAFVRQFRNRRALAGYVGLGGTPFSSGGSEREQGIGKDGNRRVRAAMVELAWMWLRWQPDSALSVWFRVRVGAMGGRIRKTMIVALARKLLVALWRYVTDGVVPDGAKLKAA